MSDALRDQVLTSLGAAFAALERSMRMPADAPAWTPLSRDPRYLALCRRRLDPETRARKVRALEAFAPIPPPAALR
ncbi:hypothetical protein [Roseisolibacter agri]|uniref:Uncharacterized protein n=1 Tax=Roseisolibacter agri TaxID=2014610 RepID=A0AA37Q1Y3_9BACT|nr:hypothetical protein [Roseisolibacter agri]GLC25100.1 hypothetical protein rosag_16130 [Roseisolibacter agri]